jgi:hypothetical protein
MEFVSSRAKEFSRDTNGSETCTAKFAGTVTAVSKERNVSRTALHSFI